MAAPPKNQFWKMRSKHGRDKIFKTPEVLWEAACEYFQWCDENPWMKNEAIKSGEKVGKLVKVPTARPYTLSGLCIFLGVNQAYFRNFEANNKNSQDFSAVLSRIHEVIYTQKLEGAAVGAFNANIIARDLGLSEKHDHTTKGEKISFLNFLMTTNTTEDDDSGE